MDQLVALQEIYESFSAGKEGLQSIDPRAIEGGCPDLVASLLKSSKKGSIDENVCKKLLECLQDVYELKRLGDICSRARLFGLAAGCYEKALSLNGDQMVRPVLLNNLGQVYARRGDLELSTFYFQKAARDFEMKGNKRSLAHVTGNLASLYRRGKSWQKALEQSQMALGIFEEMGDDFGRAQMKGGLGRIYAEMGEADLAVEHLEASIREFQRLGDKKSGARVLDRLGRVEVQKKDWEKAFKHFHKSLCLLEELGETKLTGEVLSDQGWGLLEKGEPAQARELLERAMKLLGREMQPAYQNALARLAAAYSALGRDYSLAAEELQPDPTQVNREALDKLKLASQYFARASDRYLELASFLDTDTPEVKIAASINRFHSYQSRMAASGSDEEAVALAERGISALESAVGNAGKEERTQIQALQRVLAGIKEVRAISLMGNEPWRLMKAVSNSIEYLLGAACLTSEPGLLSDALRDLSASMEEERRRESPADKLMQAASHLQQAEKSFEELGEKRNARLIGEAARLIEGVADVESGAQESISRTSVLNYRAHRDALLLIGRVLMSRVLSAVDRYPQIFSWDGSLQLLAKTHEEAPPEEERLPKSLPVSPVPATEPTASLKTPVQEIFENAAKAAEHAAKSAEHAVESAEKITETVKEETAPPIEPEPAHEAKASIIDSNLLPSLPAQLLHPPTEHDKSFQEIDSAEEIPEAGPAPTHSEEQGAEGRRFEVIESFWKAQEKIIAPRSVPPEPMLAKETEGQSFEVVESLRQPQEIKLAPSPLQEEPASEGRRFEVIESLRGDQEARLAESPAKEEQFSEGHGSVAEEERLDAGDRSSGDLGLSLDQISNEGPGGLFSDGMKSTSFIRILKVLLAIVLVLVGIDVILHLI
jgi:tetratricopeptide (TPR) repeat protein